MADEMDLAAELEQEHLQRSIRAACQPITIGVAGECEECGYDSPRLVRGRCAPCRDGRSAHQQRRRLQ
ncbi:conjugal transfer protein TraR [Sphingomonas sp. Leaf4]|uniref:conjugal transfer protein TraR n=1 Tax=Sphingomonas sp. Leaf4 TaxID=2876553 RepID=UPI001E3A4BEA|nr:conjugal transfer protein TraR [Sphingomonas sp. Leaf4]